MRSWMLLSLALAVSVPLLVVLWYRPPILALAAAEPVLTLHDAPDYPLADETPDFGAAIAAALEAGDYIALEQQAQALRSPEAMFRSGEPKLYRYYAALIDDQSETGATHCEHGTPHRFEDAVARLERWRAAMPQSVTVKIALAWLWEKSAWDARGCGWASEVSARAWQDVGTRLAEAQRMFADIDLDADPMAYYVFLEIGALRAFDRDRLGDLHQRAVHAFPRFFPFYGMRAQFLQPKWFGKEGELQAYLTELRSSSNGPDGQVAYSFAVFRLFGDCVCNAIFTEMGQDLRTIIAAYQVREQRYGLRNRDWNALFGLSIFGGACEPAHQALLQVGDKWDPMLWKEKKYFDADVAWFHEHSAY